MMLGAPAGCAVALIHRIYDLPVAVLIYKSLPSKANEVISSAVG